jgi:hypothetical protein
VEAARSFGRRVRRALDHWQYILAAAAKEGQRVVLWGAGSKAVGFLSALEGTGGIEYVVDVNPYKQGTFLPGTGQEIIAPDDVAELRPDLVIVMNPAYVAEVGASLKSLGVATQVRQLS